LFGKAAVNVWLRRYLDVRQTGRGWIMARVNFYSLGDRYSATDGHPSGFDYLRLILSVSIIAVHSVLTSYGLAANDALYQSEFGRICNLLVPMFFALSGYLVAGSLERSRTLGMFLGLRAIRIFPALVMEVVLSALILGPFVTTLPLQLYFSDPVFFKYMLNAIGDVHFHLPGVFADNPWPHIVNGQLWTIPYELYCYCALAIIALLGLKKWRVLGPVFVVIVSLGYLLWILHGTEGTVVPGTNGVRKPFLVATFLAGVSIYFYREVLPWGRWYAVAALAVSLALPSLGQYGGFLAPLPVAYATVCLGLMNPSRHMLRGADYSYGIYLYGFAVQQTMMHFFPIMQVWYLNILVSLPIVILVAAASWHFVERPANGLRSMLKRFEDRFLAFRLRRKSASEPRGERANLAELKN
jgi:peptidoglycan/LPS O-acetylase OafA/YrhL